MPESQTATFSGVNGTALFMQTWPIAEPLADVVVLHGYAEHSGRYTHVADALNRCGYSVWAYDQQGHGRSPGSRGTVRQLADYIDDLRVFVQRVHDGNQGRPVFLLGHSMGGLVSTLYACDHQDQLTGLILTGPFFQSDDSISPLLIGLSRLLSVVLPQLQVVPFDPSGISRDPAVRQAYIDDPLNYHGGVKARIARELYVATHTVQRRASELRLPVLVVQGDADPIAIPAGTFKAFASFSSADKQLQRYPECFHEVLNEPEQAEILALICGWLERQH